MTLAAPVKPASPRLLALDVFRGLTIIAMLLVNSPGNGTAFAPLEHSEWNGCTLADLVFPFFLFMVGLSIVFSLARRREVNGADGALVAGIIKRAAVIFALGLFLNGFPYYHLSTMRFAGVLQRISLCYAAGALLYLGLSPRALAVAVAALLAGYWALLTRVPVPGLGAGVLTPEGNLAFFIDRQVMSGHMWTDWGDPEGFLSTLPAIATVLLGVITGILVRGFLNRERPAPARRRALMNLVASVAGAGVAALLLGVVWNAAFPINKALWTSSFVLFTGGAALLVFAGCLAATEVAGWRRGTVVFTAFGANAILAYVLPLLDLKIQNRIPLVLPDGAAGNLRLLITRTLFEGWLSLPAASLAYALAHTALWFVVFFALYRRNVFVKV